jgi:hypothetical protein
MQLGAPRVPRAPRRLQPPASSLEELAELTQQPRTRLTATTLSAAAAALTSPALTSATVASTVSTAAISSAAAPGLSHAVLGQLSGPELQELELARQ